MEIRTFVLCALAAGVPAFAWIPDPYQAAPDPAPGPAAEARALILSRAGGSYLGIGVAEITPERAKTLDLREEHGVEITRVEEDGPAAKAGLKQGDVVLEYNGQRVEGVEQFMRVVRETPPGRDVRLSIHRTGAAQQLTVRTGSRKTWIASRYGENAVDIPRIELPGIRIPDVPRAVMSWRSSFLGIDAESLDAQLAEYFGVKEGVLVRSVARGSAAEKAGLRAGDVIVRVEDKPVSTPGEVSSAVRSARSGNAVSISAVRDKREMAVSLSTEELGREQFHAVPGITRPRR